MVNEDEIVEIISLDEGVEGPSSEIESIPELPVATDRVLAIFNLLQSFYEKNSKIYTYASLSSLKDEEGKKEIFALFTALLHEVNAKVDAMDEEDNEFSARLACLNAKDLPTLKENLFAQYETARNERPLDYLGLIQKFLETWGFTLDDTLIQNFNDNIFKVRNRIREQHNKVCEIGVQQVEILKEASATAVAPKNAIIVWIYYHRNPLDGKNRTLFGFDTEGHAAMQVVLDGKPTKYMGVGYNPDEVRARTELERLCGTPVVEQYDALVATQHELDRGYLFPIPVVIPMQDGVDVNAAYEYIEALESKYSGSLSSRNDGYYNIPEGYHVAKNNCTHYAYQILKAAIPNLEVPKVLVTPKMLMTAAQGYAVASNIDALGLTILKHRLILEDYFSQLMGLSKDNNSRQMNATLLNLYYSLKKKNGCIVKNEDFAAFSKENIVLIMRMLEDAVEPELKSLGGSLRQLYSTSQPETPDKQLAVAIVAIKSNFLGLNVGEFNLGNCPDIASAEFENEINYINKNGLYPTLLELIHPNGSLDKENSIKLKYFLAKSTTVSSELKILCELVARIHATFDTQDTDDSLRMIENTLKQIEWWLDHHQDGSLYFKGALNSTQCGLQESRACLYAIILAKEKSAIENVIYAMAENMIDPNDTKNRDFAIKVYGDIGGVLKNADLTFNEKKIQIETMLEDGFKKDKCYYSCLYVRAIVACAMDGLRNGEINLLEAIKVIEEAQFRIASDKEKHAKILKKKIDYLLSVLKQRAAGIFPEETAQEIRRKRYANILSSELEEALILSEHAMNIDSNRVSDPGNAEKVDEIIVNISKRREYSFPEKIAHIGEIIEENATSVDGAQYAVLHVKAIVTCAVAAFYKGEIDLEQAIECMSDARGKMAAYNTREIKILRNSLDALTREFKTTPLEGSSEANEVIIEVLDDGDENQYNEALRNYNECLLGYERLKDIVESKLPKIDLGPEMPLLPELDLRSIDLIIQSGTAFLEAANRVAGKENFVYLTTAFSYSSHQLFSCMQLMSEHLSPREKEAVFAAISLGREPTAQENEAALTQLKNSGKGTVAAKALFALGILFGIAFLLTIGIVLIAVLGIDSPAALLEVPVIGHMIESAARDSALAIIAACVMAVGTVTSVATGMGINKMMSLETVVVSSAGKANAAVAAKKESVTLAIGYSPAFFAVSFQVEANSTRAQSDHTPSTLAIHKKIS